MVVNHPLPEFLHIIAGTFFSSQLTEFDLGQTTLCSLFYEFLIGWTQSRRALSRRSFGLTHTHRRTVFILLGRRER